MKKLVMVTMIVAAFVLVGCDKLKKGADAKEKVTVDFFIMSQCPFGVQVDNGIKPVLDKLGNAVEFNRHFIGQEKEGQLTSMHGENEIKGDMLQICAAKVEPKKYLDLLFCMNKEYKQIPTNFDACAT